MNPDTYIPVLRNRANERQVLQSFGGLSNYENKGRPVSLIPLVEVSGEEDLEDLGLFKDAGKEVLLELPVYQTARSGEFSESLQDVLATYGDQVGFYLAHSESIDLPVVSTHIDRTVQYDIHNEHHRDLHDEFSTVVHRLMVRGKPLNTTQRESLQALANQLRESDRVLFDVVDTGYNEKLDATLKFLAKTFEQQERGVLNILNAFDDNPENLSPEIAEELGLSAFGDFGINVRYPGGGWGGETVRIRHYHPEWSLVEEFEGSDYDEASSELTMWDEWRSDHCDYCRVASRTASGDPSAWKRIRTGHYITSMLRGEFHSA